MNQFKFYFLLLCVFLACNLVLASGRQRGEQGFGVRGMSYGGNQGGQGRQGGRPGYDQGFEGPQGRNGRQSNGRTDDKKYRSNFYNDDDVYGYDATYPNGEAAYVNYRSKDARARRGPEFARTSRAYSRQGGAGERGSNGHGQINEYGAGKNSGDLW